MSDRAKQLASRFTTVNREIIAFVENCSDEDWQKVCSGEQWTVGVVARHIGAGHYGALDLIKMIVDGSQLPEFTAEAIDEANAQHAKEHAGCTQREVLGILRENGSSIADYLRGLNDADLDRKGFLAVTGGDISAQNFIEYVILQNGKQHFANMKAAVGS